MAGQAAVDDSGEEIRAKNVIIQYLEAEVIDEELRLAMNVVGKGKAVVCLDGQCEEGAWQKRNLASRTRFYNSSGEEFVFNAGTTWVEVVRPEIEVEY